MTEQSHYLKLWPTSEKDLLEYLSDTPTGMLS